MIKGLLKLFIAFAGREINADNIDILETYVHMCAHTHMGICIQLKKRKNEAKILRERERKTGSVHIHKNVLERNKRSLSWGYYPVNIYEAHRVWLLVFSYLSIQTLLPCPHGPMVGPHFPGERGSPDGPRVKPCLY